jgi:hypothetical protein
MRHIKRITVQRADIWDDLEGELGGLLGSLISRVDEWLNKDKGE